jgi:hypothetical protein
MAPIGKTVVLVARHKGSLPMSEENLMDAALLAKREKKAGKR